MKYKIIALAILAVIIYSCAAKSNAPTAETPKSAPTSVATLMMPEVAEGHDLYINNCAKCHNLYDPKQFSAEEWKPIVSRMQKKAHLDDIEGQKIYNYLTMK